MPALSLKVATLLEELKQAYRAFTSAQFSECRQNLDSIITSIPLVEVVLNDLLSLVIQIVNACVITGGVKNGEQ